MEVNVLFLYFALFFRNYGFILTLLVESRYVINVCNI